MQEVKYAVLSTQLVIKTEEDKKQLKKAYQSTNWQKSQLLTTLDKVPLMSELITIKTDNLTVIDFDDTNTFNEALVYNDSLQPEHQCQFIVKSSRKGGHFYYTRNPDITMPAGHAKQSILDILDGPGHNAIAPTQADQGKVVLHQGDNLTQYNSAMNMFVELTVLKNLPQAAKSLVLRDGTRYSDDAQGLIKSYLSNIVSQEQFDKFYNVPNPIPQGQSNSVYLSVSTRLGSDDTIDLSDYLATMTKFNEYHQRKTSQELAAEITNRMKSNANGLWRYDKDKTTETLTSTHKRFKTQIAMYFNMADGSYIVYFLGGDSLPQIHYVRNTAALLEMMEKISHTKKDQLRRDTYKIAPVTLINKYTQSPGYSHAAQTFNSAYINAYLTAFSGTRPADYKTPTRLIELLQYMWDDEYSYLLDTTKYRYTNFTFTPVITFFQGTEGSGKNLSVDILTKGFAQAPQELNYALLKDKHSNWQTTENVLLGEIGDWRSIEQADLLSTMKTISGSNGTVTFRDMQKTATTVQSLIKIWVTGNSWVKLHTDPSTQRRIHIVYMPRPLTLEEGGPHSQEYIRSVVEEDLLNFYYWLGNVYTSDKSFTIDKYMSATCRQESHSYKMYLDATASKSDRASELLYKASYPEFTEALKIFDIHLEELEWKYNRDKNLAISLHSLKDAFGSKNGGQVMLKTMQKLVEQNGNKRLKFSGKNVEYYIVIYNAPHNLRYDDITEEGVTL